jgi:hypothetical protein
LSAGGAGGQGTGEPATGAGDATNTQTTPPRPTPDPGAPPTTPAPPAGPVPPVDEIPKTSGAGQPGGPTSDTTVPQGSGARYDVRKPRSTDADVRPVSLTRSILEGKVISADSGQPEEGVRVTIIDHRGRFDDRTATTDALGRYAVNLPEGDWTVRVEMPSRKTYPVSEITVGGGRITDTSGRAVASLTIKR